MLEAKSQVQLANVAPLNSLQKSPNGCLCPLRGPHECSSVPHYVRLWPPGVEDVAPLCLCTVVGLLSGRGDDLCRLLRSGICASPLRVFPVLSTLFPFAEAIYDYCGGNMTVTGVKATAGIFATYPAPYLSLLGGFIDQVAAKPPFGPGRRLRSSALMTGDVCAARCLGPPCFCSA